MILYNVHVDRKGVEEVGDIAYQVPVQVVRVRPHPNWRAISRAEVCELSLSIRFRVLLGRLFLLLLCYLRRPLVSPC